MRVFITGATGFLGSHLTRVLLDKGCEVLALIRPGSDTWRIADVLPHLQEASFDILSSDKDLDVLLEKFQPEMCFHFAWYAKPGKYLSSGINLHHVVASLALGEKLVRAGCKRLIVAGTCAEYDLDLGYLSEASPTRPSTLYAASKLALYLTLSRYGELNNLELVWPRLFYMYGPAEDEQRLIANIISTLIEGAPTRLTPGEQIRDYLHVIDAVEAVWELAASNVTGPVNVGSGMPVTVREVAVRLGRILRRPDLVHLGDLPYRSGDPMFVCANNHLLVEKTGWRAKFSLEAGLSHTLDWWRANRNRYEAA